MPKPPANERVFKQKQQNAEWTTNKTEQNQKKNATIFWLFLVFYGQSVTHTLARRMENNEWLMDMDVLYRQCALCVCVCRLSCTHSLFYLFHFYVRTETIQIKFRC